MRRETRLTLHVVLSVFASLALTSSASAGTKVVASEDKLAITGDDGPNEVRIDYADGSDTWDVTIGGGIDSWDGCEHVSATRLSCPYTGPVDVMGTSDTGTEGMGDGNDTFTIGYGSDDVPAGFLDLPYAVRVDLGSGDDFFGGSEANEIVLGQKGDDVLDGAEGHDWLGGGELRPADYPASPSQGFDQVFGGPGWDVVYDGDLTSNRGPDALDGGGCTQAAHPSCPAIALSENSGDVDFVYYYFRDGGITLNLANGGMSQGESGEGDTVRKFERAWTGEGADTVTGNTAVNWILTSGGDDTIDVSGDPGHTDRVDCGAGLDRVTVDPEDQWLVVDMDGDGKWCVPSVPIGPPPPTHSAPPALAPPTPARGPTGPVRVAPAALVERELPQAARALARCGTAGLLRKVGCRDSFTTPGPGIVAYLVTAPAAGARATAVILIASGRKTITAPGTHRVRVKATKKGRKWLRKARRLRATLTMTFTDPRGNTAKRSTQVMLRR